jgi:death-on-curing protein
VTWATYVALADALAVHDFAIARFGGSAGLRDEGLLESALAQPLATFDGRDLYPQTVRKACRCAFGIICDHPFVDGNKRTGAALLGACLRAGGVGFAPAPDELLETTPGVADGSVGYEGLVSWVESTLRGA